MFPGSLHFLFLTLNSDDVPGLLLPGDLVSASNDNFDFKIDKMLSAIITTL